MGQNLIPQAQAMGFNKGIPYPGLDGHPRRITPIPISKGPIQSDEMREGYAQVAKTIFGAKIHDLEKTEERTIGSTTISTEEIEIIKREVRDVFQRVFPRINLNTDQPVSTNMGYGMNELEKPNAEVIDLAGSTAHSAPQAIAGSDVSIASTRSNTGQGETKFPFHR